MTADELAHHVIWDNLVARGPLTLAPEQQFVLKCMRCGERYVAALPCSLGMLAAVCRQHEEDHRHCKPRPVVYDELQAWRAKLLGCLAMRHAAARRDFASLAASGSFEIAVRRGGG